MDKEGIYYLNVPKAKTSTFIFINFVQIVQPRSALVVVDVQNDFISGSLASPRAAEVMIFILTILIILILTPKVISPINTMVDRAPFTQFWYSLDWHPPDHISFIENISLNPLHSDNKVCNIYRALEVNFG